MWVWAWCSKLERAHCAASWSGRRDEEGRWEGPGKGRARQSGGWMDLKLLKWPRESLSFSVTVSSTVSVTGYTVPYEWLMLCIYYLSNFSSGVTVLERNSTSGLWTAQSWQVLSLGSKSEQRNASTAVPPLVAWAMGFEDMVSKPKGAARP